MTDVLDLFQERGFVIFRDVLDSDLIAEASGHVEWLLERHPERRGENLHSDLLSRDPFWLRLISDDRLVDIASLFVGPDVAVYGSHYISKPAFSGREVLWHQDGSYWNLEPMKVVTLWLAIDPSTSENGCMRVIPGSHREQLYGLRPRPDVDSVLGSESTVNVDEDKAVHLHLEPGDVEVHHPSILHASYPNLSPHRRCGLTIRYIPTSTRIVTDDEPWRSAFLLRGAPGANKYQPWPAYVEGRDFPFAGAAEWNERHGGPAK